ncbi:MAG TPA: NAD(P)H-hydrate dehydratase [Pseudobacteroides sp.]|uniref:NAD(P)H-hydrate dehydratase n=1 Tax=Pseudobacteroides sp. TaxID=1968840 RepID=UPI002F95E887
MKVATPEQIGRMDDETINKIGIPGIVLMENAALKVVEETTRSIGAMEGKKVIVLAGKGNNGGDAYAVARHLNNLGAYVSVYITSKKSEVKSDAQINLKIIENMNIKTVEVVDKNILSEIKRELECCDAVIDGIFGTGFKGQVTGIIEEIVKLVNDSSKYVVSIDIPSGVNGETGKVLGKSIKAHKTVTFTFPKTGLLISPGCEHTGELVIADIGIPKSICDAVNMKTTLIDKEHVSDIIPKRIKESSKGNYGRVLIISGSTGMTGSGCLCAKAALRSGAGLVYLGVPAVLGNIYSAQLVEPIVIPFEDKGKEHFSKESAKDILKQMEKMNVAAIGPGISCRQDIIELVQEILVNASVPIVLDADALNAVSKDAAILKKAKVPVVVTPHPGEMARLMGMSISDIQNDRIKHAGDFSAQYNVITVLKGSKTIIAAPGGRIYINPTGNPGMSTAGTGDVLTGIIAGFIGQGFTPEDSAVAGVFLHGLAGDMAAHKKGQYGIIAGDLIEELPYAIHQYI